MQEQAEAGRTYFFKKQVENEDFKLNPENTDNTTYSWSQFPQLSEVNSAHHINAQQKDLSQGIQLSLCQNSCNIKQSSLSYIWSSVVDSTIQCVKRLKNIALLQKFQLIFTCIENFCFYYKQHEQQLLEDSQKNLLNFTKNMGVFLVIFVIKIWQQSTSWITQQSQEDVYYQIGFTQDHGQQYCQIQLKLLNNIDKISQSQNIFTKFLEYFSKSKFKPLQGEHCLSKRYLELSLLLNLIRFGIMASLFTQKHQQNCIIKNQIIISVAQSIVGSQNIKILPQLWQQYYRDTQNSIVRKKIFIK